MRGAGSIRLQSSADSFLRAETFQDSPWLRKGCSGRQYVVDLVAPREGASVQENHLSRIARKQAAGNYNHQLKTKILLPRRVLDLFREKDSVSKIVFTHHPSVDLPSQFARKR